MSLWSQLPELNQDKDSSSDEDLYFDDPEKEYIETPPAPVTPAPVTPYRYRMTVEDHLGKAASEGFILFRPIFLILTLVWFFFIVFPRELFMMCFDIAFGREEQNRLPYYGSNHKGSPW